MDASERRAAGLVRRLVSCVLAAAAAPPCHADASADGLADLTLEELSDLQVTSVSKSAELLRSAPAAIYVITHDDIVRSGVTSLAEALRLAPNLTITQYSASRHVAGARGFGGAEELQNFSNKLLILIDGRSVYSPLYSGVYLDAQDVLLDDVDRIEVISGPGATLWGANAMNGVVNIVTRPSYLSDGALLTAGVGSDERNLAARYGGRLGEALSYRVYGKAFARDATEQADGASAHDDWDKAQGGFRLDWTGAADTVTAQGDLYRAGESQLNPDDPAQPIGDLLVEGGNLLARWQHRTARHDWQLQGYYDYSARVQPAPYGNFALRTFDLELQDRLSWRTHRLIWGAGVRRSRYAIGAATMATSTLAFDPDARTLTLANLFVQDTIALAPAFDLTLGLKLERDPYSGWAPLPEARLAWRPDGTTLVWAAAARAIRAPTPFDRDVVETLGGTTFIVGGDSFTTEKLDAFELGYRAQPLASLSLSVSAFFNVYDDLRSLDLNPDTGLLPLVWGNGMRGHTYGLEAWAKWQVLERWRLAPGLRLLHKNLEYEDEASAVVGIEQSGDDARHQFLLSSALDLGAALSLDATLRYVGALPAPHLDSYVELQASLDYALSRHIDVSLSGFNLLESRHREYPSGAYIGRSVIAQLRWKL